MQPTTEHLCLTDRIVGPFQIVVIENEYISASLRLLFEKLGQQVETAYDGRSGIDLVKAIEPNIVFTRIQLPDMDGFCVAREIRRYFPKRPVIVAHTGYGRWEIGEAAKRAGFDLFITKPALFTDLQNALSFVAGESSCEELRL